LCFRRRLPRVSSKHVLCVLVSECVSIVAGLVVKCQCQLKGRKKCVIHCLLLG
jgi:hypothetical protein